MDLVITFSGCSESSSRSPTHPNTRPRPSAMASSPHSQTPPRAGTPAPQTPARLIIAPTLRPTHSLSNLHVHMSGLSPGPVSTTSHTGEESSASSIINVDMGEGILVPEADAEVGVADGEVGNAYVSASSPIGDEASKKALRDHLRNTLSKKGSYTGAYHQRPIVRSNPRHADADVASRRSRRRKMSVDADVDEVSLELGPRLRYSLRGICVDSTLSGRVPSETILRPHRRWQACVHKAFGPLFLLVTPTDDPPPLPSVAPSNTIQMTLRPPWALCRP